MLLIDGVESLANMGRLCFPGASQIVDFYQALEHAGKVLAASPGSREHPDYKKRLGRWARRLLNDKVEQLITPARQECEGFFIGSGVIEAGCKTVIGSRRKQLGMFWGKPGAENVLALRCIQSSRRLGEF